MNTFQPSGINPSLLKALSNTTPEEIIYVNNLVKDWTDNEISQFALIYNGKRKDRQTLLLCCLIGLVGFSGIHRFVIGQTGMGVLYFFTGGLCLVGTLVDAINIDKLANEFNREKANETFALINYGK